MLYINYKCTVCRRTKAIEWDSLRALPDHCTITKGCQGRLSPQGDTKVPAPVPTLDGVTDWYPRNQVTEEQKPPLHPDQIDLATSKQGALTIAVRGASESVLSDSITLRLLQRVGEDIKFTQYTFKPQSVTSTITGKDVNGKNLRFDTAAINEDRVQVRVDGIPRPETTLNPNTATLSAPIFPGSIVDILVYSAPINVEQSIVLTRNGLGEMTDTRGSWMNVKAVEVFEINLGARTKWWLYTADNLSGISVGKMKVINLDNAGDQAIVLTAGFPYSSHERSLTHYVPLVNLYADFNLGMVTSDATQKLVVDWKDVVEAFPTLQVNASQGFIQADTKVTSASSEVVIDDTNTRLASSKILGPV
jgi:hypothetical protein